MISGYRAAQAAPASFQRVRGGVHLVASLLAALSALAVLGGMSLPVQASTVLYRCGPEGREYSQLPCRGTDGKKLEIDASRTPEDMTLARQLALQDQQQANTWEKERLRRETAPARSTRSRRQLVSFNARPPAPLPQAQDRQPMARARVTRGQQARTPLPAAAAAPIAETSRRPGRSFKASGPRPSRGAPPP